MMEKAQAVVQTAAAVTADKANQVYQCASHPTQNCVCQGACMLMVLFFLLEGLAFNIFLMPC